MQKQTFLQHHTYTQIFCTTDFLPTMLGGGQNSCPDVLFDFSKVLWGALGGPRAVVVPGNAQRNI